jgi:O-antigen/teichoic acid export membrane protein
VAIVFANQGFGVYALALGAVAAAVITVGLLFASVPPKTYLTVQIEGMRPLLVDSARVFETSIVEVTIVQVPVLVISWLGATALGLFNRTVSVVQLPVQMIGASVSRVFVTALVRAQPEPAAFAETSRSFILLSTILAVPICAGIAGASHEFTATVMGTAWLDVGAAMPFLAISTAAILAGQVLGTIADAAGRLREKSRLLAVIAVLIAATTGAGATMGLTGAAAGFALGKVAQVVLMSRFVSRAGGIPLLDLMSWYIPGLSAGILCYGWALAMHLFLHASPVIVLIAQIAGCGIIAAVYYLVMQRPMLKRLAGALRS